MNFVKRVLLAFLCATPVVCGADTDVNFQWGVRIPMRDGVKLSATVYTPAKKAPAPCIFTLTPYISQSYHDRGMYFASHGFPFLTIDVRGRGNSEGEFHPLIQEAKDGYDIVEWDARVRRCDRHDCGQVGRKFGLAFGPASLVDLPKLHLDWYAWTMQGGQKPELLQKHVAWYVMFADKWRYADSLEAVTGEVRALNLGSRANATDVLSSGSLGTEAPKGDPDHYVYDPRDTSIAAVEARLDPASLVDQTLMYANRGKELVYHTEPFDRDTEVSGFFRLSAWLGIDQPDTAFRAGVYEIRQDGSSIVLTSQVLQARYRQSAREPQLVKSKAPQRYELDHFPFVSQEIKRGSRLRLVIAPVNSIQSEKNYNSGGVVAEESMEDARTVTVTLYHDRQHTSTLYVPLGTKG